MKYKKSILLFTFLFLVCFSHSLLVHARTNKEVTLPVNSTSTELQALLDLNKNNEFNLTIKIPKGTYIMTQELRIYSNTTIQADKEAKIMKNHMKGAFLANDMSNDKGGYTTTTNIKIQGGIWDSSMIAQNNKGTESFRFIHASNVTVKDATVCNVPDTSHLITFAGVKNGVIQNCKLYGYVGKTLKEAIQLDIVHDNVIVPSTQSSKIVYDDLACIDIIIKGNEIYDFPRAIGSHTSIQGVFHKNVTIKNNNLHDLDEAAIKLYNYVNTTVSDNTIKNAACGILAYTYMTNESAHYLAALPGTKKESLPSDYKLLFERNNISDIKQYKSDSGLSYGDAIRVIGSKARPLTTVTIKSNICTNLARYGIFSEYTPYSYIGGNTIKYTSRYGICMSYSTKSKLRYNKLSNTGTAKSSYGGMGISDSSNVYFYKNTIYTKAKNGIYLASTVKNSHLNCNIIYGCTKTYAITANTKNGNWRTGNKIY